MRLIARPHFGEARQHIRLRGFLPHVTNTNAGRHTLHIHSPRRGGDEPGLSEPDDRQKSLLHEVQPCDKSVTRYVCCFGFFGDGWHLVAGRGSGGKKKVENIPPTPPQKCAEKLPGVRALERQTCITTTRRHAVTQVGSPQLSSGRQMSAVLHLIWITLGTSLGNFFFQFGTHTVSVTHRLDTEGGDGWPFRGFDSEPSIQSQVQHDCNLRPDTLNRCAATLVK